MVSKERIIDILKNYSNFIKDHRAKIMLIKDYCISKGKDDVLTEVFLTKVREINMINRVQFNKDLIEEFVKYILSIKMSEYGIIYIKDKDNKIILIY